MVSSGFNSARKKPWDPIQLRRPLLFFVCICDSRTKRRCCQIIFWTSQIVELPTGAFWLASSTCLVMLGRERLWRGRPNRENAEVCPRADEGLDGTEDDIEENEMNISLGLDRVCEWLQQVAWAAIVAAAAGVRRQCACASALGLTRRLCLDCPFRQSGPVNHGMEARMKNNGKLSASGISFFRDVRASRYLQILFFEICFSWSEPCLELS